MSTVRTRSSLVVVTTLIAGVVAWPEAAGAADGDAGKTASDAGAAIADREPASAALSDPSSPPRRLEWRWERFRAWEYPVTAAALGAAMVLRFAGPRPSADWTGGVLLDDWVEKHTAIKNPAKRSVVVSMTDVFFYGSMAYRLVDSAILPLVVWRSPEVALQMSMIDLESFGFVAITLWGGQAVFGRRRPYAEGCTSCDSSSETNRSFFAGHPAVVLTAAGLTCMHHAHLPLYGGGAGDGLPCGVMIGAAALTGVGRLVTEEHHLSDVLVGYGVGLIAGWVLPEFLHYRMVKPAFVATPPTTRRASVHATVAPAVGPRDLGVELRGTFE